MDEIETDYFAHLFFENPKAYEEVEDTDFDKDAILKAMEENPDDWETVINMNGGTG